MSSSLFTQIVANYINSWEGHTQVEGENYILLRDRLENTTIEELNIEYNALTQQHLWNVPLLDLFYDEFRNRMFSETTFSITTSWHSVEEWKRNPFVLIMVGFEDSYPIIDGNGLLILPDDPKVLHYTLTTDDLSTKYQEAIIRLLLHNHINANVEVSSNKIQIVGLENTNAEISFVTPSIGGEHIQIKASIREAPDWNLYCQIYTALKNQNPVVIDPMQDKLINQLIDIDEARDILEDHGMTREGDLFIEVETTDQYEEPVEIE